MWVNILTNNKIMKYMLLTDEDIGDGETYVMNDLRTDGWKEFCNVFHQYQDCKKFMHNFYPEYSELRYEVKPITLKEARAFINLHHRHHVAPQGHKFSLAITDGYNLIAVAVVGRPVSRFQDDGITAEVTRMCVKPGYKNACSMLYAKAIRVSKEMGYQKVITYTLGDEAGSSLKAAGFDLVGISQGGSWSNEKRKRVDKHPIGQKKVWEYKTA